MISLLTILSFVMMSSCYAKGITAGKGVIDIVAGGVLVANSAAHLSSSYNYGKTSNSNSSNSNSGDKKHLNIKTQFQINLGNLGQKMYLAGQKEINHIKEQVAKISQKD